MYIFIRILIFAMISCSLFIRLDFMDYSNRNIDFYVVIFGIATIVLLTALNFNNCNKNDRANHRFITICTFFSLLLSIVGIFQYLNITGIPNGVFRITGCFDNPSGFGLGISLLFPISVFPLYQNKASTKFEYILSLTAGVCSCLVAILSSSRCTLLSCIIVLIYMLLDTGSKYRNKFYNYSLLFVIGISLVLVYELILKSDSLRGRLLIWSVCYEMFKDHPLLGFGYGGFDANYMIYQSNFLSIHPSESYAILADNVRHPMNEFIKILINYGIIGLSTISICVIFVLKSAICNNKNNRLIIVSELIVLIVFSTFSYPFHYTISWIFCIGIVLFELKYILKFAAMRFLLIILVVITFVTTTEDLRNHIKWMNAIECTTLGKTNTAIGMYKKLLPKMRHNFMFIYDYSALLFFAGMHDDCNKVSSYAEAIRKDYDLSMLRADNYRYSGQFDNALKTYEIAAKMIPCRFVPLECMLDLYIESEQEDKAFDIAKRIVCKRPKITSDRISCIKAKANQYIKQQEI